MADVVMRILMEAMMNQTTWRRRLPGQSSLSKAKAMDDLLQTAAKVEMVVATLPIQAI